MKYDAIATSRSGFVQQLAVQYVTHGYHHWVEGWIPEGKDRAAVLERMVAYYNITHSANTRWDRKRKGLPNCQLLCYGRYWVLLSAKSDRRQLAHESWKDHPFYRTLESYRPASKGVPGRKGYKHISKYPIQFEGYSIGYSNGHVSVRIARSVYQQELAFFVEKATKWSEERLIEEMRKRLLRFERYRPVQRQHARIIRAVNEARLASGFTHRIPKSALFKGRYIRKPFEPVEHLEAA